MLTKICSSCGIEKPITEFYKNNKCLYDVVGQCKDCYKLRYEQNKEKRKQKDKEYRSRPEIKEIKRQKSKEYYEKHKEIMKQKARENYYKNIDKYHEYDKQRNRTEGRKNYKKEYSNKYRAENIEKLNEYDRQRYLKRRESIRYVLGQAISGGIRRCINNTKADRHWEALVNFTFEELKSHLEKQFSSEMNWDNYGSYWEIDHIIPQNTFNISSAEDLQFQICWSLLNLRPLTVSENRSRPKDGSDIPEELKQKILGQKV